MLFLLVFWSERGCVGEIGGLVVNKIGCDMSESEGFDTMSYHNE